MAKSEVTAPAFREILPLKSSQVVVNRIDHLFKQVVVNVDDSLSYADLMADPKLFRLVQLDRSKALNALDEVILVWFDKFVFTRVDFADDAEVVLLKAPVINRRERDKTPWQNNDYEVRAVSGQWSYFRRKDGVQMTSKLFSTWEAARQACITEQSAVRVA